VPDHPPDALQELAFVAFQLRVELLPTDTVPGLAVRVTAGTGVLFTETVVVELAPPPGPVHDSV
jgi:hypothetical protein